MTRFASLREAVEDPIRGVYWRYVARVAVVEGCLKGGNRLRRALLVMPFDQPFQNYLLQRLWSEGATLTASGRTWISALHRYGRRLPPGIDFCLAELPGGWRTQFAGECAFRSPGIVRQVLDVSGDWAEVRRRFNRKKRELFNRLSARNPFEWRVSNLGADFDFFYDRMYLPLLRRRFGNFGRIESRETLRGFFDRGFLLFLLDKGAPIAASLCAVEGTRYVYFRGGVLDGDDAHVRNDAQAALYFLMIRQAREQGLAEVDLGHSRAFFGDGVYRHKREWGSRVSVDADLGQWLFCFAPGRPDVVRELVAANPLIVETDDGLVGCCAVEGLPDLRELRRLYGADGIVGVSVHSPSSREPVAFSFDEAARDDEVAAASTAAAPGPRTQATVRVTTDA